MSSIEFFRPESQRPLDADGFELPPWLNPFLSDYNPELVEPAAADVAWLNDNPILPPIAGGAPEAFEPTDADWDDMYAASYGFGDDDIQAAGLPVG